MTANQIKAIITDENYERGYDAFGVTVINRNWVHICDGATTACYRVEDIAELGEERMRAAFSKNDEDLYSHWCSDIRAYHLEDLPKSTARAARHLGLVTEGW